jgi:heme-degrading monooxygenase HmoA
LLYNSGSHTGKTDPAALFRRALATLTETLGATAMATSASQSQSVVLINTFEVPEDRLDETIASWEKARDFLKAQPGFISTRLHRSLTPAACFRLVNVAQWETPAAYQAAIAALGASSVAAGFRDTVFHASLYEVIREDG